MDIGKSIPGKAGARIYALVAVAFTAIVVACGGYGGSSVPPSATGAATKVSFGAITGFGSVHLNGQRFETTHASIDVDGKPGTQDDLRVGDVIEVKGHHDDATNTNLADEIEFRNNVRGPVSAVDTTAHTLIVLGQTVLVSGDTSFDSTIVPASLSAIAVGEVLQVSGMPNASGQLQAMRISRAPAGAPFQVIGTATSTDASAHSLNINALVVDFSAAKLTDFPTAGPQDGNVVEAAGTALEANGALKADELQLRTGKEMEGAAGSEVEIEGMITRFDSASDFAVAGRAVMTSASTTFKDGAATDLALNVKVEVEGTVDSAGVLQATEISVEYPADVGITAQVTGVDTAASTVTLLGITVHVDALTRFEDQSSQQISNFGLSNIQPGDWVEIRASETAGGSGMVLADRLERVDAQPNPSVAGLVASVAQPNFMILSLTVSTTGTTSFIGTQGQTTSNAFFASALGQSVTATGSFDGTTLTATQVAIGQDD